jgi:hypothetical protein
VWCPVNRLGDQICGSRILPLFVRSFACCGQGHYAKCSSMWIAYGFSPAGHTIKSNSLMIFFLKYSEFHLAFSSKMSIRVMPFTSKKIVIITFRGWLIGQAIGSTSLRVIVHIREGLSLHAIHDSSPVSESWSPAFACIVSCWAITFAISRRVAFDWMSTCAELIWNGNISRPSLPASESPLFVAIYPTGRLALAPSHVYHAQATRPGSREFQFLGRPGREESNKSSCPRWTSDTHQ